MSYLKQFRRKLGIVTLVVACGSLTVLLWSIRSTSSNTVDRYYIQAEAIDAIDYSQLDEPLSALINLAKEQRLVGEDVSTFAHALNVAILRETFPESTNDIYNIILPAHANKLIGPLTDCRPLLSFAADRRTRKIKGYSLYMQEF